MRIVGIQRDVFKLPRKQAVDGVYYGEDSISDRRNNTGKGL